MKKIIKKYPLLGSSANPDEISLTIKSVGVWLIPMVIAFAKMRDIELNQSDLLNFVEIISSTVAGLMMIYGLVRKFYIQINKK